MNAEQITPEKREAYEALLKRAAEEAFEEVQHLMTPHALGGEVVHVYIKAALMGMVATSLLVSNGQDPDDVAREAFTLAPDLHERLKRCHEKSQAERN